MEETKTLIAAETAAGKPAFKAPVIAVYQFPPEKGIDATGCGDTTDPFMNNGCGSESNAGCP